MTARLKHCTRLARRTAPGAPRACVASPQARARARAALVAWPGRYDDADNRDPRYDSGDRWTSHGELRLNDTSRPCG